MSQIAGKEAGWPDDAPLVIEIVESISGVLDRLEVVEDAGA